jgi:hypothetical protein
VRRQQLREKEPPPDAIGRGVATDQAIRRALERAGIEFIERMVEGREFGSRTRVEDAPRSLEDQSRPAWCCASRSSAATNRLGRASGNAAYLLDIKASESLCLDA